MSLLFLLMFASRVDAQSCDGADTQPSLFLRARLRTAEVMYIFCLGGSVMWHNLTGKKIPVKPSCPKLKAMLDRYQADVRKASLNPEKVVQFIVQERKKLEECFGYLKSATEDEQWCNCWRHIRNFVTVLRLEADRLQQAGHHERGAGYRIQAEWYEQKLRAAQEREKQKKHQKGGWWFSSNHEPDNGDNSGEV